MICFSEVTAAAHRAAIHLGATITAVAVTMIIMPLNTGLKAPAAVIAVTVQGRVAGATPAAIREARNGAAVILAGMQEARRVAAVIPAAIRGAQAVSRGIHGRGTRAVVTSDTTEDI